MNHVIPFPTVPADIRALYEHLDGRNPVKPGQPYLHAIPTAIRASRSGWWLIRIAGNPVLAETAAHATHPQAFAGAPNVLTVRPIRVDEIPLFEEDDQVVLRATVVP